MATWTNSSGATQLTTVTTVEQFFSITPDLDPNGKAHAQVKCNFPGTPTSNCVISVYATVGSTYDSVAWQSFVIDNSNDNVWVPLLVSGIYQFRVGAVADSTHDNLTVDMNIREATT